MDAVEALTSAKIEMSEVPSYEREAFAPSVEDGRFPMTALGYFMWREETNQPPNYSDEVTALRQKELVRLRLFRDAMARAGVVEGMSVDDMRAAIASHNAKHEGKQRVAATTRVLPSAPSAPSVARAPVVNGAFDASLAAKCGLTEADFEAAKVGGAFDQPAPQARARAPRLSAEARFFARCGLSAEDFESAKAAGLFTPAELAQLPTDLPVARIGSSNTGFDAGLASKLGLTKADYDAAIAAGVL